MRTLNQQDALDPKSLLYYAPRRLRGDAHDAATIQPLPGEDGQAEPTAAAAPPLSDDGLLQDPVPKSLQLISANPGKSDSKLVDRGRKGVALGIGGSFAVVTGIVIGIVFVDAVKFSNDRSRALSANDTALPAPTPAPTLTVEDATGEINELLPLGVKVSNYTPGATVSLGGLAEGTEMSTGAASGAGKWVIAVDDLPNTLVIPPRDYLGPMNIVAEIYGGNGKPIVRSPLRLSWRQPAGGQDDRNRPSLPAANSSAAANPAASIAARQIDPKEAAALLKRAEELVLLGDLPSARLLLRRLAEARNARAALELGATYDPKVIKRLGNVIATPDPELARTWYQKARDWGLPDASNRLDALASADH